MRVASRVKPWARLTAMLHDVVEDGIASPLEIREWFGERCYQTIVQLSRHPELSYAEYIESLDRHGALQARTIKIADLQDNLERCDAHSPTLKPRYEKALKQLGEPTP